VSRRTDIPAFYSEWLMNRLREGYVMVRNPMNYHQISKIELNPKLIDFIVFWTKNPLPLLPYIDEISNKYSFYFQYTLNSYGRDIERNISSIDSRINTFKELSKKIGNEKIIWRYDPIAISDKYTLDWHIKSFEEAARKLHGFTNVCVISFIDIYPKVKNNIKGKNINELTIEEMNYLAEKLSSIASQYGMELRSCAEGIDLSSYNIKHNSCIDGTLINKILGCNIIANKDKNQRSECGCIESIDIGQYNTCHHGCSYCYANFNPKSVETFSKQHNPLSPLLIGDLEIMDKVTIRKLKSLKQETSHEISLF
jgi:DNA repair photolyase